MGVEVTMITLGDGRHERVRPCIRKRMCSAIFDSACMSKRNRMLPMEPSLAPLRAPPLWGHFVIL